MQPAGISFSEKCRSWLCCYSEKPDGKIGMSRNSAEKDRSCTPRIFGLPTCCGPDGVKPDEGSSGCCYKTPDGEVVNIDPEGRLGRTGKPVLAGCFDEHIAGAMPNGNSAAKGSAEARVPPANFNGSWRCTRVSGDMEAFLRDMGLSEPLRAAASAANYGTGVQVQNITQVGDAFEVENILRAPVTMQFRVGEGEQRTVDQVGKPIIVDPRWDGTSLYVTSRKESGEPIADSKRYLVGDSMVIQFTSPQGTVVERIFARA